MPKIFSDRTSVNASPRQVLTARYNSGRANLLLLIAFTLINIVMAVSGDDSYFLFSATIPYYIAVLGATLGGAMPEELYTEIGLVKPDVVDTPTIVVAVVIALVILSLYLLCWFFSKKRSGWMMAALVLFSIDTAFLFITYGIAIDMILDIIFHGWVIYSLVAAIFAHKKLQSLPEDEPEAVIEGESTETAEGVLPTDSTPIRDADTSVKSRVLLEITLLGHDVCYRRVKKTNELVIDGQVYDEYTATIERPHYLVALIGGHEIVAGYDGTRSYIALDGEPAAKKIRWY